MRAPPDSVLSAFSGAGGLDLGMERAGFETIGCIESNPFAVRTLKRNRSWPNLDPGDIIEVAKNLRPSGLDMELGSLGGLIGGPPCQPFSKAAQWSATSKQGVHDPRAECLASFFSLAESFLPRFILIENVQGFISGPANAGPLINRALARINRRHGTNYALQSWIANAADYGIPQRRRRAILFAARGGESLSFPAASHLLRPITAWDAIGKMSAGPGIGPELRHWARLLPSIPEGKNYLWHTRRGGGLPLFGYRTKFWSFLLKLARDQPAWTLPAQPGPYTGPFHWDNRLLTISEMARLQSFPMDWKFEGPPREQVRQIGNATPPLLAEVVGRSIIEQLFKGKVTDTPTLAFKRRQVVELRTSLQAVPNEFLHLRREWRDHPGSGQGPKPITPSKEENGKAAS